MTRARGWAGTAAVVVKTLVVVLAVLQLLQLLGVTRVELARADTHPRAGSAAEPPDRPPPAPRTLTPAASSALVAPPTRPVGVKALAQRMAAERGWTGREWTCLHTLVLRESSWDPHAQNPTSTAYGLFQFLRATWPTVGARKTDDPEGQIRAGLRYVRERYGSPCSAWAFWLRQRPSHWY